MSGDGAKVTRQEKRFGVQGGEGKGAGASPRGRRPGPTSQADPGYVRQRGVDGCALGP
jgi:hypothetical protein